MLPRHHPGRVQITFGGHRLAANAGLILPATLALRLGLPQLLRKRLGKRLGLGDAPGRANTGDKLMTLVASALAGGDALRVGGTACGAAHFLRETVSRVRYGGASGQLTVRADSGFYTHAVAAVCRRMDVRFSITVRQPPSASTPACAT